MPSGGRQRGGVAAATAFYGNKAGGAASAGIKQSKRQRQRAGLSPRAKSSSDMEVGFKSPRAVARWQQHKLAMAGMVTELRPWDDATRPFTKTVSTPAPVPRRDFSKISPYEIQKFEQWHDRHPHLDYPREIPDPMFYHKKGKGPLPTRDDTEKAAKAYGGRHVKKLPGLRSTPKGRGASYSLSNGKPNTRGRTAFLNAIFQDVGAGDGTWLYANPRALRWLPHELLRAEEFFHLTSVLTNLHFVLKKSQECGVAAVRDDLQRARKAFKSTFQSGRCFELGTPMEMLLDWQARVQAYLQFVDSNIAELAALPASIFRLGAASPAGGYVHSDVQSAVLQAEHSISVIHTLLDPLQSSDADAVNNIPRLLSARQFLEVIRNHGVWLAMDSTALDRIATAEMRADQYIQRFRDRLQEVPEAIDRVGQVLLRGPEGQSEHWEKDSSFESLARLFGEGFFGYEPLQAFACFRVVEAQSEQERGQRDSALVEQLSEETGFPQHCFELSVHGLVASLAVCVPSSGDSEGLDSFERPQARDVARRIMEDACDPESDLRQGGLVTGGPAPPQFWREACIFITCTIADMQPERDMLSRFVLPALKLACRRRRLRLSWVMCGSDAPADLHKNLTWVQASTLSLPDGKRVPFSLAVLGSKLGWNPGEDMRVETVRRDPSYSWVLEAPFKNWSLNQLEICQAQLQKKDSRGFIFLRDPTFVDSEAFQQSPIQVQEIFLERSPEAKDLDEEFKTHVANYNYLTKQKEDRIFEYKTVFVDGEVQDRTGPGVRVAFSGLFSFGLDVYISMYKMIDSVYPTCLSSQPELVSTVKEEETAREAQLQLHASSIVEGTRTSFISEVCELLFSSRDDVLVAVNGPTGSGRTAIMASVCLQARAEQARGARGSPDSSFVLAWVIHEPWQTEFEWLHCIAAQVCRRAAGVNTDEYVGECTISSITNAIWDMMSRGISVVLIVDGLSPQEQGLIGHMFNTLQGRSNAEWFGDNEKKASLGRFKVVVSTHGFVSEMHRRVQIIDVPRLSLEERLRICWSYVLKNKSDVPTKTFESLCASKSDAAYPRYLQVAMRFLSACQAVFPGQLAAIKDDLSPHLSTLYENDVLPFVENQGDASDVREMLSALINCKGMLPGEFKWVLQSAGQPGDDGRVGVLMDLFEPFGSAHRREDRLLCLGCKTLQECIARRYNLEVKEIPLHHSPSKGKAEAVAQNRLVHRRLLAEMEAKAGFKPKPQKKDSPVKKGSGGKVLAPTAIAQDAARDAALDDVAAQVVHAAIWNAQQDAYSDALVENGRRASLFR